MWNDCLKTKPKIKGIYLLTLRLAPGVSMIHEFGEEERNLRPILSFRRWDGFDFHPIDYTRCDFYTPVAWMYCPKPFVRPIEGREHPTLHVEATS